MKVDRKDGHCRRCGGELEIVSADGATISVECQECGDGYEVEPHAFGDEALLYYFDILTAPKKGD